MNVPLRSLLFIPGDSDKKLAKVADCGADAVILDLEDSVAPAQKADARKRVAYFLGTAPRGAGAPRYWVRINPLDTGLALEDLAHIMPARPEGILQPKTNGPACVRQVSHYLDAFEAAGGAPDAATAIIAIATETAIAPFHLGEFAGAGLSRLGRPHMGRRGFGNCDCGQWQSCGQWGLDVYVPNGTRAVLIGGACQWRASN